MTETETKLTELLQKQNEGLQTLKNENNNLKIRLSQIQSENQQLMTQKQALIGRLTNYQEKLQNALNEINAKQKDSELRNSRELQEKKNALERENLNWREQEKKLLQEAVDKKHKELDKRIELLKKDEVSVYRKEFALKKKEREQDETDEKIYETYRRLKKIGIVEAFIGLFFLFLFYKYVFGKMFIFFKAMLLNYRQI